MNTSIRDVNYGYNINIQNKKPEISLLNFYENIQLNEKFISKGFYQEKLVDGIRIVRSLPPKGPIRLLTMCIYCQQKGPDYHTEHCPGPYNDEILTEEGIETYAEKIVNKFTQEELEKLEYVFYKDIFPNRGIQRLLSEQYKLSTFPNVVQLKYKTETIEAKKHTDKEESTISNDHENGIIIPLKITKHLGCTAKNVPFFVEETNPTKFQKMMLQNLKEWSGMTIKENENTWITDMNCIFKVTQENQCLHTKNLNIHIKNKINGQQIKINDKKFTINSYTFSSYTNSILFKILYKKMKVSVNIKGGGSIHLFISYGSTNDFKWMEQYYEKESRGSNKILEQKGIQYLNEIKELITTLIDNQYIETKIEQSSVYYDKKILNTSVPWTINNNKFKYQTNIKKTGSFPPQPETCRNRIPKMTSLTKADIKRPVPFSFSQGKPPMKGLALVDEGRLSTGSKLIGGRKRIYEPCCEVIQGEDAIIEGLGKIKYEADTNIIDNDKLKRMKRSIDTIRTNTKDFIKKTDSYLASTSSSKEKLFRRMLYGFPNNKVPEDTAKANHIRSGYETKPILKSSQYYDNNETTQYEKILQEDIYSGVYVPGTQLKNFGGNNQLIRDSRKFIGLLKYNDESMKPLLIEIIKCYFDKFSTWTDNKNLRPLIPLCDKNLPSFIEKVSTENMYYIIVPKKAQYKTITVNNDVIAGFEFENYFFLIDHPNEEGLYTQRMTKEIKSEDHIIRHPVPLQSMKEIYKAALQYFEKIIAIESTQEYSKTNVYQWYDSMSQDYMQKEFLHLKVKSKKNKNLIEITLPSEKAINTVDNRIVNLFPFQGKEYLFVPTRTQTTLTEGKVYCFAFNFFRDTDGSLKLIPNQPFIVVGQNPVKNIESDEITLNKLYVIMQPVLYEEFNQ